MDLATLRIVVAVALCASAVPARADAPPPAVPAPAPAPAAPAAGEPAEKKSIVVLDLEAAGVEASQAALVTGLVADAFAEHEQFNVLQKSELAQIASFEADKQSLGCSESSCLAEIAGALGAAYVVFGRVGTLDGLVLVQLNLFDAGAGKPVAREDIRVGRLADVAPQLPHAVGVMLQPLTGEEPPPVFVEAEPGASPLVAGLRWGGVGTAGLGLVVGGVATGVAAFAAGTVLDTKAPADARNGAKTLGAVMVVTTAVAAAVAVVGGAAFGASFVGGT